MTAGLRGEISHLNEDPTVTGVEHETEFPPVDAVTEICALPCWVKVTSAPRLLELEAVAPADGVHTEDEQKVSTLLLKQIKAKC